MSWGHHSWSDVSGYYRGLKPLATIMVVRGMYASYEYCCTNLVMLGDGESLQGSVEGSPRTSAQLQFNQKRQVIQPNAGHLVQVDLQNICRKNIHIYIYICITVAST